MSWIIAAMVAYLIGVITGYAVSPYSGYNAGKHAALRRAAVSDWPPASQRQLRKYHRRQRADLRSALNRQDQK